MAYKPQHNADKAQSLSGFIRGGQVTHHNLTMLFQVIRFLVWATFVITLFGGTARFMMTTDFYDLKVAKSYVFASVAMGFNNPENPIAFTRPNGVTTNATALEITTHPGIRAKVDQVEENAKWAYGEAFSTGLGLALLLTLYFRWRGRRIVRRKHIQGSELVERKALLQALKKHNRSVPRDRRMREFNVLGLPYPNGDENKGTMLVGAPGTGKTNLFNGILDEVEKHQERALIYDKMGTFTETFYDERRGDVILNPFDRRSFTWNLFDDVVLPTDLKTIARAFLPSAAQGNDPLWVNGARIIFEKVGLEELRESAPSTNRFVWRILKMDLIQMALMLKGTTAESLINVDSPKTSMGFRATLAVWLDPLERLPQNGPRFSIRDWVRKDGGRHLFLTSSGRIHETMRPLITAWIEIAVSEVMSLQSNATRRLHKFLDEIASLQEIPSLPIMANEVRQKGACIYIGLQSKPSLDHIYGINSADAISTSFRTRYFFSTGDGKVAKWVADQIGERIFEDKSEGLTYGAAQVRDAVNINDRREKESLVLNSDIMDLKDNSCFVRFPNGIPVGFIELPYIKRRKIAEGLVLRDDAFDQPSLEHRLPAYQTLPQTKGAKGGGASDSGRQQARGAPASQLSLVPAPAAPAAAPEPARPPMVPESGPDALPEQNDLEM